MDVVYKGGSLLWSQLSVAARMAAALPRALLACIQQQQPPPHPGVTYLEGCVRHVRRRPVTNSFEYAVRMVLVDLGDPPPWFSATQAADHLSLDAARQFAGGTTGRVLLLTNPVVAGYTQNPISVYYCFNEEDGGGAVVGEQGGATQQLAKCIAEVTNTPWRERVSFVFNPAGDVSPKALHVSPFMDMHNAWHLKASSPHSAHVTVSVLVSHPTLGAYFDAHLLLKPCAADQQQPAETAGLGTLWRYGFMPQRVAVWIYLQALLLIAKGCPIYPKPSPEFRAPVSAATKVQPSGAGCPYVWRDAQEWPWYL